MRPLLHLAAALAHRQRASLRERERERTRQSTFDALTCRTRTYVLPRTTRTGKCASISCKWLCSSFPCTPTTAQAVTLSTFVLAKAVICGTWRTPNSWLERSFELLQCLRKPTVTYLAWRVAHEKSFARVPARQAQNFGLLFEALRSTSERTNKRETSVQQECNKRGRREKVETGRQRASSLRAPPLPHSLTNLLA